MTQEAKNIIALFVTILLFIMLITLVFTSNNIAQKQTHKSVGEGFADAQKIMNSTVDSLYESILTKLKDPAVVGDNEFVEIPVATIYNAIISDTESITTLNGHLEKETKYFDDNEGVVKSTKTMENISEVEQLKAYFNYICKVDQFLKNADGTYEIVFSGSRSI